jgi:hypothetical protein
VETWELIARERVRDTIATYTHEGDRFRLEEFAGCFTDDGVLENKNAWTAKGRADIIAKLSAPGPEGAVRPGFFVRHFIANIRFVSVAKERIETTEYFVVYTNDGVDHWGRYRDVLVPVGERWLFEHRYVAIDAYAPDSWAQRQQARFQEP